MTITCVNYLYKVSPFLLDVQKQRSAQTGEIVLHFFKKNSFTWYLLFGRAPRHVKSWFSHQGSNPMLPALEVQSLNHWTTREGLRLCYVLKGPRLPWRTAFFPGRARRSGGRGGLTSPLAALLHAVLVDVQREEHVWVAKVIIVAVLLIAPPGGDGRIQEEGSLLRGGCPQLALVLQLQDTREGLMLQARGLACHSGWLSFPHSPRLMSFWNQGPCPCANSQLNLFISEN